MFHLKSSLGPRLGLFFVVLIVSATSGEFLYRYWAPESATYHDYIQATTYLRKSPDLISDGYPVALDPHLGWTPAPPINQTSAFYNAAVSIRPDGVRRNGPQKSTPKACTILATGDSFTFGDEVSDQETWPAYLEQHSPCSVLNLGVPAYGIDQAILRARAFTESVNPRHVILSLISDDIRRTEQDIRDGLAKPYYSIEENQLHFHAIGSALSRSTREYAIRKRRHSPRPHLFSRSRLLFDLVEFIAPEYWIGIKNRVVHHQGQRVSCELIKNFHSFLKEKNIEFTLIFQYMHDQQYALEEQKKELDVLQSCLKTSPLQIIDFYDSLSRLKKKNLEFYNRLYREHMTSRGNQWTADFIFKNLTF